MVQSKLLLNNRTINHYFFNRFDQQKDIHLYFDKRKLVKMEQIHGNKVFYADGKNNMIKSADGLVTDKKIFLGVKTADCIPLLFADRIKHNIAVSHAGWKGLMNGIIGKTVEYLIKIGSETKNIITAIGPHIGKCCYNINFERVKLFINNVGKENYLYQKSSDCWYLDLATAAKFQLESLGIPDKNIDIINECTKCNRSFHSFRRDGLSCGRMLSVIGLT